MLAALRGRIVAGHFPPGARLPGRRALQSEFRAGAGTVQAALNQLTREGFVTVRGGVGTMVSDRAPHLHRFAIVYPARPDDRRHWRHLWTVMQHEAQVVAEQHHCQIAGYHLDLDNDRSPRTLIGDLRNHRLAGVIFAYPAHDRQSRRVLAELAALNVPGVALSSDPGPKARRVGDSIPTIGVDWSGFFELATQEALAHQRRRIAVLYYAKAMHAFAEPFDRLAATPGVKTGPHHWVPADLDAPEAVPNLMAMMMHAPADHRPDALIISDDNFSEPAMAGLLHAGVKIPDDLMLICHCNFPIPASQVLPNTRIGFDIPEMMRLAFETVRRPRDRKPDHVHQQVRARRADADRRTSSTVWLYPTSHRSFVSNGATSHLQEV
mgnify:CR=1 FL=1